MEEPFWAPQRTFQTFLSFSLNELVWALPLPMLGSSKPSASICDDPRMQKVALLVIGNAVFFSRENPPFY